MMPTIAARRTKATPPHHDCAMVLDGHLRIPANLHDLQAFRRWTYSDQFPDRGEIDWLGGILWIDLAMEQLFTHNLVKTQITMVLGNLVQLEDSGYFCADGVRFSHVAADVSAEPDAMYIAYSSLESGRVKEIPAADGGVIELEGSPDMVLEVVSASSLAKDTQRLMGLYFLAGVQEYWLVDVRGDALRLDIYKRGAKGFTATRKQAGKLRSAVFGKTFQLVRDLDRRGNPRFQLLVS